MRITCNQMVVETQLSDAEIDRIFQALADATRRDIVRRVIGQEQNVSDLARRYDMSFAAVQKHVAVLERSGLVAKRRAGREQLVRPLVDTIGRARELLDQLEALWRGRIDRMDAILAEDAREEERA